MATSGVPIFKVMVPEGKCIYEDETCDPDVSKRILLWSIMKLIQGNLVQKEREGVVRKALDVAGRTELAFLQ